MSASPLSAGKHTATLNNLKIHYTVLADSPKLPPVVLHPPPWGIGTELYIKTFTRLASQYTVIIPSPRGNNDSERPASPEEMSSRHIVSDLEALRIHLGLEKFPYLMGHSAGGNIALGYAITYSSRVDKLFLFNSDLMGYKREDTSFFQEVFTQFFTNMPQNDDDFKAFMLKTMPLYFALPDLGGPDEVANSWAGKPTLWAFGTNAAADSASAPGEGSPGDGNTKWRQIDELDKVEARTLVLTGREDRTTAPEVSSRIASGIKKSLLCIIDACGHMSWIERPDVFWEVLEDFLDD